MWIPDPWHFGTDPDPSLWPLDPDPAIFIFDLQDVNKELFFSAYYFLKVHLHHFSKKKVVKNSQDSCNQGFSYYIFFRIEGSGFVYQTNGTGSGPPTRI